MLQRCTLYFAKVGATLLWKKKKCNNEIFTNSI